MKLDTGTLSHLSHPAPQGGAITFTWICAYPGCGIERNLTERPAVARRGLAVSPARVGSARWALGPEGWRRVHYMMDTTTGQRATRVFCPDHAHVAGYGGLLDTPTLEALLVLTALLQG